MEATDVHAQDKATPMVSEKIMEEMPEGLLSNEKLPLDLPEDFGATPSQIEASRPSQGTPGIMPPMPSPGPAPRHLPGTPGGTPSLPSSSGGPGWSRSYPATPVMGPGTGAGHSATPAGKWRGSAGRPSPMSATTSMGQRPSADPYTFTVTDRKVRVREHERDVPLYVLIRKWVQNDPETELMQQPPAPDPPQPAGGPALGAQMETGAGEPLGGAEKPEEAAEEPERAGEEPEQYAQPAPVQAPLPLAHRELPPTELLEHHQRHWLAVRKHNTEKCKYRISRLRSRLNALLQAAPQQSMLPPVSAAS